MEQQLFSNIILLGDSLIDYYRIIDRNYNLSNGFSIQSNTHMHIGTAALFILHVKHYRLFTRKGYTEGQIVLSDSLYLNVQGDKGRARPNIAQLQFRFPLSATLHID